MRIALDVSIQGGGEPTGVERAQATLIAALAQRPGLELLLCSPRPLPQALRDLGVTLPESARESAVRRAPLGARMPVALWREAVLPAALRAHGARLLHSPVAAVPLRAGCPVIATLHELPWVERVAHGDSRWTHRARVALAARVCRRIVCVSERTRAHFAQAHPEAAARALVVANAVDPRFTPAASVSSRTHRAPSAAASATDSATPSAFESASASAPVLAVGRLRRKKNLELLLQGFAQAASCVSRRLVLAGPDGDAASALRARARAADLRGRVDFLGHVSDERLLALYRGAACVVFPSRFEGFGLPVLEAMACGTPVIASRQGAAPEVAGEAAQLFDAQGASSLAAALDAVLFDTTHAAALRARGLEHAARFSAARAAQALETVYAQVLAGA